MVFEELSPTELTERRKRGENWLLLDVRERWEVGIVSLDDARHIPMNELPSRLSELDSDRPVAVLCHSGGRSARVAQFLVGEGFARVANVAGGIDAWAVEVDESLARY